MKIFEEPFTQQILRVLGWRAELAEHALLWGGGLQLYWPGAKLTALIWPELKRLDWFTHDGKRRGTLVDFGNAPLPTSYHLDASRRRRPGRPALLGGFLSKLRVDGTWTTLEAAEAWVKGGKKVSESTRIKSLVRLRDFCKRLGSGKALTYVTQEDLEEALRNTKPTARPVCARFANDVLVLRDDLGLGSTQEDLEEALRKTGWCQVR